MTSPLDKVCIAGHCAWISHCSHYRKYSDSLHRQHVCPQRTAEYCDFYVPIKKSSWGDGHEPND